MTKKLVRDVEVQNYDTPKKLEAEPRNEFAEKVGKGPSNHLPVGLPSPSEGAPRITTRGTPKGIPPNSKGNSPSETKGPLKIDCEESSSQRRTSGNTATTHRVQPP
ncbi:unnamed protein product [Calypogeia fissa]